MTADTLQTAVDQAFADVRSAQDALQPELKPREIGVVTSVSTGVAQVSGLPGVGFEELLEFSDGLLGIAFNVDEHSVGVVLLGDNQDLRAGAAVTRSGRVM